MIGLDKLPSDVYVCLTSYLDRHEWNALKVASKKFYHLSTSKAIAPPWPERCFVAQGKPLIASFSLSYDAEYMAVGCSTGSIEIWSRRIGKISYLPKNESLASSRIRHNLVPPPALSSASQMWRSQPVGSILKFAPVGYTLASAHENIIFLQNVSNIHTISPPQQQRQNNFLCQILEIQGDHGAVYEVTYLGFSHDASQLIARYGKNAYIWRRQPSTNGASKQEYNLLHQLLLSSYRCHMASSPCMNYLAVTNASCNEKGLIDVWNLNAVRRVSTIDVNDVYKFQEGYSGMNNCATIQAHNNQVIRGLEFVHYWSNSGIEFGRQYLVSATLQGEIKFWKYEDCGAKKQTNDVSDASTVYTCLQTLQVPGKIFSLALSVRSKRFYFAVGQSRGNVRAWRVSFLSAPSDSPDHPDSDAESKPMDRTIVHTDSDVATANLSRSSDGTAESTSSHAVLREFLSVEVGEHVHHDNIKLLSFTPDGMNLVASRAYDARIWFHTFRSP